MMTWFALLLCVAGVSGHAQTPGASTDVPPGRQEPHRAPTDLEKQSDKARTEDSIDKK